MKKCFFVFNLLLNQILRLHGGKSSQLAGQNLNTVVNYSAEEIKTKPPKIKQNITNSVLQKHQCDIIHSNRKSVAKLRCGNHDLRIETGRHCVPPKIPENQRTCQ